MKWIFLFSLILSASAHAHVPALLLPLKGTPISSYFLGQSDVSRAVYSELTRPGDFFVGQFNVKPGSEATLVQLLTPYCENIPQYERFQPSALIIKGDVPWKLQGESNSQFIARLKQMKIAEVKSNFPPGKRPKFYEEFGNQYYWVGGEWRGNLQPGLYAVIVFDDHNRYGNFTLGLNEKEAWTPDLFKYTFEILPRIQAGICRRSGFSGRLKL